MSLLLLEVIKLSKPMPINHLHVTKNIVSWTETETNRIFFMSENQTWHTQDSNSQPSMLKYGTLSTKLWKWTNFGLTQLYDRYFQLLWNCHKVTSTWDLLSFCDRPLWQVWATPILFTLEMPTPCQQPCITVNTWVSFLSCVTHIYIVLQFFIWASAFPLHFFFKKPNCERGKQEWFIQLKAEMEGNYLNGRYLQ